MRIKVQFISEAGRTRVMPLSGYPSHYRVQMPKHERGTVGSTRVVDVQLVYRGSTPFLRTV